MTRGARDGAAAAAIEADRLIERTRLGVRTSFPASNGAPAVAPA